MRNYSLTSGATQKAPTPAGTDRPPRASIQLDDSWQPRSNHVDKAEQLIERSGVLELLEAQLDHGVGRPRFLSVKALLVAMMLNGLRNEHSAQITEIASVIATLSTKRLKDLGCRTDHWPKDLYKRVDDLFNRLVAVLDPGFQAVIDGEQTLIDHVWFSIRVGVSPVTAQDITSSSVAIDGTAIETPARLLSGTDDVVNDGPAAEGQPVDEQGRAPKGQDRPKARVIGYGIHDRRKIWTKDLEARGGYRTATNRRRGGTYVGYEAHFSVLTRDVASSNGADKATLSPPVPGLIINHVLVPAGSSRTAAVLPLLLDPRLIQTDVDDVVVDPGYTIPDPHGFFTPLHKAGIHVTWQVTSHHAKSTPFDDNAFIYNGHLISETLPKKFRNLPQAPRGSNQQERAPYQASWNEVARYRYRSHTKTSSTGVTRFRDPIDAGSLRSPDVGASMRRSREKPRVKVPNPDSYSSTVRASAEQLPRWSKYLSGTTAHEVAYFARRGVAESANSTLRGDFVDLDGRHFNVFGLVRINILLGFTIAGYNHRRLAAFRRAHSLPDTMETPALTDALEISSSPNVVTPRRSPPVGGTDPPQ